MILIAVIAIPLIKFGFHTIATIAEIAGSIPGILIAVIATIDKMWFSIITVIAEHFFSNPAVAVITSVESGLNGPFSYSQEKGRIPLYAKY